MQIPQFFLRLILHTDICQLSRRFGTALVGEEAQYIRSCTFFASRFAALPLDAQSGLLFLPLLRPPVHPLPTVAFCS